MTTDAASTSPSVVLIDANHAARLVLERLLADEGVQVQSFADGADALQALADGRPIDLVLVSRHLPDMGAVGVLRRLRALPGRAVVPVILITGDADELRRMHALEGGFTDVLLRDRPDRLQPYLRALLQRFGTQQRARILLVEDSATVAATTTEALAPLGVEVVAVGEAATALARLEAEPFDLVIIDVVLPGPLTGLGLLSALRSRRDELAELPVLAYSGYDERARRIEMLRRGANDYLSKPIDADELRARAGNLVRYWRLLQQVRRQYAELARVAVTDALTGLYNRHMLDDLGQRYVHRAWRTGEPLTVMMLDLDYFKNINDQYGHDRGDEVLRAAAQRLQQQVRPDDLLVRFGGEEFALLMPRLGMDDVAAQAERLRTAVAAAPLAGLPVTVSVGVCVWTPPAERARREDGFAAEALRQLLKCADRALYHAKHNGRNCAEIVPVTDPLAQPVIDNTGA
ncbi:diguanylate cyclase [Tepidimonas charontis]|uniref:diguanylate cyclase n=1 Tax=Tepidimonas charontis TaxID=2267262 RepID=A0A554XIG0_9BURK|nr:diguanylate cyclase [Tepidimonas charontis]TSE35626.1 Response regulator PleD [Tepidimonas charontis]